MLDALRKGWPVTVLTDAIAAVDLEPDDGSRALQEMQAAGAAPCVGRSGLALKLRLRGRARVLPAAPLPQFPCMGLGPPLKVSR